MRERALLLRACSMAFGKLPQQVLVGSTENVRLDIIETKAILSEDLGQSDETVVADEALPGSGRVEVHHIDDTSELRILPR